MFQAPFGRAHTLALRRDDRGVFCGADGLFVGSVPLLDSKLISPGKWRFSPRPLADLNRDLERCYGLPIDATAKIDGIGAVARALNDGDPARACIAAVFLRLPEIPDRTPQGLMKCATALGRPSQSRSRRSETPRLPGGNGGRQGRPVPSEDRGGTRPARGRPCRSRPRHFD
jgi:hypothetical protein